MAAEFTTKVRLVRCPKCRLLLPELPNFQVYKCGGCGAILQAKNRVNGLRSRSTGLNGTVAAQMNGLGRGSEDEASSSTNCSGTLPDLGECSSDQVVEKSLSKSSGECSSERNTERYESKLSEGSESSSSSLKGKAPALEECSLERRNEREGSCSSEGIESGSSSLKASPHASGECSLERRHERDGSNSSDGIDSSSSTPKAEAPVSGVYSLERSHERDESKSSERIAISSSPKARTPELGERSLEQNTERGDRKSSEGIESCSSSPKATFPDSGECISAHNNEKNQKKFSEDEESRSSSQKVILPELGEHTSIQNNGMDPDKLSVEDYGGEQLGDLNLPNENQNNQSDQNGYGEPGMEPLGISRGIPSSMEFASSDSKASLPITAASSEALKDEKSLPVAENLEVDIVVEIDSDSTSSSRLNAVATRRGSSIYSAHIPPRDSISSDIIISSPDEQSKEVVDFNMDVDSSAVNPGATRESGVTAHMPAQESSSLGTLTSSPNEQLRKPHNIVPKSFDHLKSSDTFETTDFHSPRSEFSAAVNDRSKSPENRSHHAYDGSVSSYDGIDDQFYNHSLDTLQDVYTAPNLVQSKERFRREKFLAERMGNRGSELPYQARSSRSSMSDKNGDAMKYRHRDQDVLLPPRIPRHPSRDHARVPRDEYIRMASLQGDSLGGYGNGRFMNQMHNELQSNSNYQSVRSVSAAADELTLLRMMFELQKKVHSLNIVQASRQEKPIPQYHNYDTSEEELFHGLNPPRGLRRSRAGSHYIQEQSQYRPIPFSSEATTSRHQADPSFMHHYPQDRQFSAPLPLPIWSNTSGLHRVHPGYASSQWDSETMSDDQRHNSHEVKRYYEEKQQMPKRHFRPIAGGAPILICYKCFKPLQIPADFLLFKRKCHRLQCGACSKVLEFSLHKRTHILPYGVNAVSEVEDQSYGANADPVSCSDDYGYGLSYCKSGSTEAGDHAGNIAPSNSLENTIVHERNMSYGSNNPTRGRQEIILRRSLSQNKDRNPVERFKSARTSSHVLKSNKHSSEREELPQKSSSPLHRLMGYKSPSQVIRGIGLSRSGSKNSARN